MSSTLGSQTFVAHVLELYVKVVCLFRSRDVGGRRHHNHDRDRQVTAELN
jgi:hypothetical protein